MDLVPLAATACGSGACPTVYVAADGDLVVQGSVQALRESDGVPVGEARVKIPRDLLIRAAKKLCGESNVS
jgi:hypothetical protein